MRQILRQNKLLKKLYEKIWNFIKKIFERSYNNHIDVIPINIWKDFKNSTWTSPRPQSTTIFSPTLLWLPQTQSSELLLPSITTRVPRRLTSVSELTEITMENLMFSRLLKKLRMKLSRIPIKYVIYLSFQEYLPIDGLAEFNTGARNLLFGADSIAIK